MRFERRKFWSGSRSNVVYLVVYLVFNSGLFLAGSGVYTGLENFRFREAEATVGHHSSMFNSYYSSSLINTPPLTAFLQKWRGKCPWKNYSVEMPGGKVQVESDRLPRIYYAVMLW